MRSIAVKKRYNVLNRVLHIPEGVTKIDYSAFCNCANLKSVTIPSSMTWIDDVYGEESDCRSITNITYNGTISQWKTIEKQSLRDVTVNCIDGTISKKADLDGNGKIDTSDIFDAMVYVAYRGVGLDGGFTDEQVVAADIDGDGKVDSTDIYYMLLYYVALQKPVLAGCHLLMNFRKQNPKAVVYDAQRLFCVLYRTAKKYLPAVRKISLTS